MTDSSSHQFNGQNGIKLAASFSGDPDGPPVMLSHGGGQTRHSWGTTLDALGASGWQAYSVDLRGHGESEWSADGDYSLEVFAADLISVAESFDTRPVLVGASLGGLASLAAIGEHPDLDIARGLVLVDVTPRVEVKGRERIGAFMTEHMAEGFGSLDEVADAIQAYNPHRPRPSDLSGLEKNLRRGDGGRWYWHWDPAFITGTRSSADETRSSLVDENRLQRAAMAIEVPTLLVRGRMSDIVSDEGVAELRELVPHAQVIDVGRCRPYGGRRPQRPVQRCGGVVPRIGSLRSAINGRDAPPRSDSDAGDSGRWVAKRTDPHGARPHRSTSSACTRAARSGIC